MNETSEELYNDTKKYIVGSINVEVTSDKFDGINNTVVIIDNSIYYHCGDFPVDIDTALAAFCKYFNVFPTEELLLSAKEILDDSI